MSFAREEDKDEESDTEGGDLYSYQIQQVLTVWSTRAHAAQPVCGPPGRTAVHRPVGPQRQAI